MNASREPRPILSGPVLTRVGGIPVDALDIVADPTRLLLAELAAITERLRRLSEPLTDVLFNLVPRLDDDIALRRKVLSGKRAVFNLKRPPWDQDTLDRVTARLTPAEAGLLEEWMRVQAARAAALAKLEDQLSRERAETVQVLRAALDGPGVLESMAIAAPEWVRHADLGAATPRNVKTLYSYVSRAAVKTSPFSGLTTVGVAGTEGAGRARSRAAAAMAMLALHRLARSPRTAHLLTYRGAPVRPAGGDAPGSLLLHGEMAIAGGVIWRQDSVMEADHAIGWLDRIGEDDLSFAQVLERLGGADPFARFIRLLDAGVLTIVLPWRLSEAPLERLAELVDGVPESPISADDLRTAHALGDAAHRERVKGRLAALDGLGRYARSWADPKRGRPVPDALLYEDRETEAVLPDICAIPSVRDDLLSLGELMRPHLFRSHIYDLMLEEFVAAFGAGGTCDDPLAFFMRLAVERDGNGPLDVAMADDMRARANPGERAWLPVGPTSAPPSAAVLFQLEAEDYAQVAEGRYRLVVNHFSAGSGALFTRFVRLLGADFRSRLVRHITSTRPGVACRELVLWTDCNTAQAECANLLPPLSLPGEPTRPDAITLDDTRLVHDAGTDTLSLVDRRGEPIGLTYLGLIPQHMVRSYARLLVVLADPWVNASPHSDYTLAKLPELLARCRPGQVVPLPRVQHGRVVTRRASWLAPTSALPLPRSGETPAELVVRMDAFRRAHGMPEEVFVHHLGGGDFFTAGDRKPLWVSLASPTSAQVLEGWLAPGVEYVRITEALPARNAHPQLDAERRRRATEHAAMLIWPEES